MSYLIISVNCNLSFLYFLHVHYFQSVSCLKQTSLWNLNLQWHMLLLSTLVMRGICLAYICVCVFVRVNLFALSTRGVFWWTLSHPEQKRQQVLSSAACFLTIPPPPKGVTFSPCFIGLCIFLFSIRSYMIIFNLPCRPNSLQYRSWSNGGDVPNSSSFPCGIYLRSRWGEERGLGACSYLH